MSKVKERAKLRTHIKGRKKALDEKWAKFKNAKYVDPNEVKMLIYALQELAALQRQLNAMSQKADEKRILQRAAKKVSGK